MYHSGNTVAFSLTEECKEIKQEIIIAIKALNMEKKSENITNQFFRASVDSFKKQSCFILFLDKSWSYIIFFFIRRRFKSSYVACLFVFCDDDYND